MTFDLGYLEYEQSGVLPLVWIIVISVIVAVVCIIIAIIVIIIIVRIVRSKRKVDREYQQLLKRLADLEASVRDQCKQGSYIVFSAHTPLVKFLVDLLWNL